MGNLQVLFSIPNSAGLGIYSGDLLIKDTLNVFVPIDLIVTSKAGKLLDITSTLKKKALDLGETLEFQINIFNLGRLSRYDVFLTYEVRDSNNELIDLQRESVAIETSLNLVRSVSLPDDLKPGRYLLNITAAYDDHVALSANTFTIGKTEDIDSRLVLLAFLVVPIYLVLTLILNEIKTRRGKIVEDNSSLNKRSFWQRIKRLLGRQKIVYPK